MINYTTEQLVAFFIEKLQEKKAQDIVSIDIREMDNAMTEFLIICTGTTNIHVQSIADFLIKETRKKIRERPFSQEGFDNAFWVLLDYINIVIHIFQPEYRSFYDIEGLWADGKIKKHIEK
jgi:ribosome-associated protein